jgi:hypothetical protein
MARISRPESEKAAISIYYPTHARFVGHDVILVFWAKSEETRRIIGYQLKETD